MPENNSNREEILQIIQQQREEHLNFGDGLLKNILKDSRFQRDRVFHILTDEFQIISVPFVKFTESIHIKIVDSRIQDELSR